MDPEIKKKVLRKIVHGVYVIGVTADERKSGFTATWVTQVSFKPPLVLVGVREGSASLQMIQKARVFSINFLGTGQKKLAEHFLKPAHLGGDKLEGVPHRAGKTGAPLLEDAPAFVECEVRKIYPVGDHSLVVGKVVEAGLSRDMAPLTLMETGWHYGG